MSTLALTLLIIGVLAQFGLNVYFTISIATLRWQARQDKAQ